MAFQKRCRCKTQKTCAHEFHFVGQHKGHVERGPFSKYAHLLEPGQQLPRTREEATIFHRQILTWLAKGRPLPPPPPSAPPPPRSAKTVAAVVKAYDKDHASKLADKGAPSILKRIVNTFGAEDYTALFDARRWKDFLGEIEDETSRVNRNRHFARWRHLVYWLIAEERIKDVELPFYNKLSNRMGIRWMNEGEGRTRRLVPELEEEQRLVDACTAYAKTDGGMMLGRLYCAIDAGLRRGEMLKLPRAALLSDYKGKGPTLHVQWRTSKTARARHVPVTSDRLRDFLKTRRFAPFPFGQLDGTRVDGFRTEWETILHAAGFVAGHYEPHPRHRYVIDKDEDLHWHDLRHEAGSRMAEQGMADFEIMELLGHTSLMTVKKYMNARFSNLADKMRRAHVALGI
jgi:hypothetical protein